MLSIFRLVLIKVALDLKKYPRKESSAIVVIQLRIQKSTVHLPPI